MAIEFPNDEWLHALMQKLNSDEKYAHVARNWEGDILFHIQPDTSYQEERLLYLDLWHGKCREAFSTDAEQVKSLKPAFTLSAPYTNFLRILNGELDPMQAMLTRKLIVKGNMAYMMRNVPVVLDFVRCAKEVG